MRQIILCADDFGQNQSISEGILQLVQNQRLSAVSCMTNSQSFSRYEKELKEMSNTIALGLHINLTHDARQNSSNPKLFFSLQELLLKAFLRLLPLKEIYAHIEEQMQIFKAVFERAPDFIDGHQHVHQLPGIRDIVIDICNKISPKKEIYIRVPANISMRKIFHYDSSLKKTMIFLTGSLGLRNRLRSSGIPFNTTFSGIYDFKNAPTFRANFLGFLNEIEEGGVIMCHPGLPSDDFTDPLQNFRHHEFNYLMSDQFLYDCRVHQIHINHTLFICS